MSKYIKRGTKEEFEILEKVFGYVEPVLDINKLDPETIVSYLVSDPINFRDPFDRFYNNIEGLNEMQRILDLRSNREYFIDFKSLLPIFIKLHDLNLDILCDVFTYNVKQRIDEIGIHRDIVCNIKYQEVKKLDKFRKYEFIKLAIEIINGREELPSLIGILTLANYSKNKNSFVWARGYILSSVMNLALEVAKSYDYKFIGKSEKEMINNSILDGVCDSIPNFPLIKPSMNDFNENKIGRELDKVIKKGCDDYTALVEILNGKHESIRKIKTEDLINKYNDVYEIQNSFSICYNSPTEKDENLLNKILTYSMDSIRIMIDNKDFSRIEALSIVGGIPLEIINIIYNKYGEKGIITNSAIFCISKYTRKIIDNFDVKEQFPSKKNLSLNMAKRIYAFYIIEFGIDKYINILRSVTAERIERHPDSNIVHSTSHLFCNTDYMERFSEHLDFSYHRQNSNVNQFDYAIRKLGDNHIHNIKFLKFAREFYAFEAFELMMNKAKIYEELIITKEEYLKASTIIYTILRKLIEFNEGYDLIQPVHKSNDIIKYFTDSLSKYSKANIVILEDTNNTTCSLFKRIQNNSDNGIEILGILYILYGMDTDTKKSATNKISNMIKSLNSSISNDDINEFIKELIDDIEIKYN